MAVTTLSDETIALLTEDDRKVFLVWKERYAHGSWHNSFVGMKQVICIWLIPGNSIPEVFFWKICGFAIAYHICIPIKIYIKNFLVTQFVQINCGPILI